MSEMPTFTVDEIFPPAGSTAAVLDELLAERQRQTAKHGDQSHLPNGTGPELILCDLPFMGGNGSITFEMILLEEVFEAIAESDLAKLRAELIQVAAVAVQFVEAIDRRPSDAA